MTGWSGRPLHEHNRSPKGPRKRMQPTLLQYVPSFNYLLRSAFIIRHGSSGPICRRLRTTCFSIVVIQSNVMMSIYRSGYGCRSQFRPQTDTHLDIVHFFDASSTTRLVDCLSFCGNPTFAVILTGISIFSSKARGGSF